MRINRLILILRKILLLLRIMPYSCLNIVYCWISIRIINIWFINYMIMPCRIIITSKFVFFCIVVWHWFLFHKLILPLHLLNIIFIHLILHHILTVFIYIWLDVVWLIKLLLYLWSIIGIIWIMVILGFYKILSFCIGLRIVWST